MVIAMFLAHLVGDFILQWDDLAELKSREIKGVLMHGVIIFLITLLFALPFQPTWWQGVLFISLTHILIDGFQFYVKLPISPLGRFLIDQTLHILVIFAALLAGGYLHAHNWTTEIYANVLNDSLLVLILGYAFLTMPAWVFLKFLSYALIEKSPPAFLDGGNKYIDSIERVLITTFVFTGQFLLVPLAALPRLLIERSRWHNCQRRSLYIFEVLSSITLAIAIGLGLRLIYL